MEPVYEVNTCSLTSMFFLICSCFKASGPNCFLKFFLEIRRQKHFLTAKLKKAAKTTGPGLYYPVSLLSIFNQNDRNVAKRCLLPSQWSTNDPRNSYLNFDKTLPSPPTPSESPLSSYCEEEEEEEEEEKIKELLDFPHAQTILNEVAV